MADTITRKRLKQIQKEKDKLKKEYEKLELLPCQNDAELKLKDERLKDLMAIIYSLEKERDRFILDSGRITHST